MSGRRVFMLVIATLLPACGASIASAKVSESDRLLVESTFESVLGQGRLEGEIPGTTIRRLGYGQYHVSLLVTYELVAISLTDEVSPPVLLRPSDLGTSPIELRVGMSTAALMKLLGELLYIDRPLAEVDVEYDYFPELGLGVRSQGGRVVELILARVPQQNPGAAVE